MTLCGLVGTAYPAPFPLSVAVDLRPEEWFQIFPKRQLVRTVPRFRGLCVIYMLQMLNATYAVIVAF